MRNLKIWIKNVIYFKSFSLLCLAFAPYPLYAYDRIDGIKTRFHTILACRIDYYASLVNGLSPYKDGLLFSNYVLRNKLQQQLENDKLDGDQLDIDQLDRDNQIDGSIVVYKPRWYQAPPVYFHMPFIKHTFEDLVEYNQLFFQGKGLSVLAKCFFSLDIFRLRIGVGGGINMTWLKKLTEKFSAQNKANQHKTFIIPYRSSYVVSCGPLGLLGLNVWRNNRHAIFCDCMWLPVFFIHSEAGSIFFYKNLYSSDFGFTWESKLNHYLSYSVRLACERAIDLEHRLLQDDIAQNLPSSRDDSYNEENSPYVILWHQLHGLSLQVGMSILIPDKLHCPIPGCRSKYDHNHNGHFYRGHTCIR